MRDESVNGVVILADLASRAEEAKRLIRPAAADIVVLRLVGSEYVGARVAAVVEIPTDMLEVGVRDAGLRDVVN